MTPLPPGERGAVVTAEELDALRMTRSPDDFVGLVLAGPTLLAWGTSEQQERFLRPLASGEHFWCQLFSEPGAGSDLAGLRTRAERQPDGTWKVNGQKVWSSLAGKADFGLLLARTNPEVPQHKGITFFVLDMRTPGVEVRPLRQMTGEHQFDEVFFTDVIVADEMRVGAEGDGWRIAVSTLMAERSGLSGRPAVGQGVSDDLVLRAVETGAWEDLGLRDDVVAALVEERALEMTNLRAFVDRESGSGGSTGAAASVTKLVQSELLQRLAVLKMEVEPTRALAWSAGDKASADAALAFLYSRAYTIAGGTSEIQRNIIAERVLGLPKEPRIASDQPPETGR